jgi:3-keto-5-aminohexanoate cleavage enzyme
VIDEMSAETLGSQGLAILEVAVNEATTKEQNPNVPYGPDEVIADALACAAAGASAIHFHGRHSDGVLAGGDAEATEAVIGPLATAVPDLVVWPAQLYESVARRRTAFAPLEVARLCFQEKWDPLKSSFASPATPASMGTNPGDFHMLPAPSPEQFRSLGAIGSAGIYGLGDLRWVAAAQSCGRLNTPICVKLFFSETTLFHNAPTREIFDLLVSQLDEIDHETLVVPYGMTSAASCEELLHWALEAGLGIRVGIGESPRAYPTQRNVDLVGEAVQMIRSHGLEPASPEKLRRRLVGDVPPGG